MISLDASAASILYINFQSRPVDALSTRYEKARGVVVKEKDGMGEGK